jgi:hypothetical protein
LERTQKKIWFSADLNKRNGQQQKSDFADLKSGKKSCLLLNT